MTSVKWLLFYIILVKKLRPTPSQKKVVECEYILERNLSTLFTWVLRSLLIIGYDKTLGLDTFLKPNIYVYYFLSYLFSSRESARQSDS